MAQVPTLGEINSFRPDADLGGGVPGVVIDNREMVRGLNEAANQKAQNDWNKYLMFQNNLKDLYKNIGDTAALETATPDKEYLQNQAADIFKEIGDNPRAVLGGGAKYNEIQQKLGKLRSEATESKLNQVYDFVNKQYITQNPELNTPENQQTINDYFAQPLGQRKAYVLNMPTLFDSTSYANETFKNPSVTNTQPDGTIFMDANGNESATPTENSRFIKEGGTTTTVSHDNFLNHWMAGMQSYQDKYGHGGWAEQEYKKLTPEQKSQYDNPDKDPNKNGGYSGAEALFHQKGEMEFGSQQDIITKTKGTTNELSLNAQKLELDKNKEAFIEWAKKQDIAQGWAQEDRLKNADGGTPSLGNTGNALYGIPLTGENKTDGDHELNAEQQKYLGQTLNVLGDVTGGETDPKPKVHVTNGQIDAIIFNNKRYSANEIQNLQIARDDAAKTATKMQYPTQQIYVDEPTNSGGGSTQNKQFDIRTGLGTRSYSLPQEATKNVAPVKIEGFDVPVGGIPVRSKKTGKIIGYELNGGKFKF